jgi:hypothetical protein
MDRKMAFQFSRQRWFPRPLKRMMAEFLDFMVGLAQANHPFLPLLNEVLAHSQARTLVGFRTLEGGGLAHIAAELEALAKSLGREDYVWKAGKRDNKRGGFVIYLIGYRTSGARRPT